MKKSSFSLIELILVLAIIAVVGGMVTLVISGISRDTDEKLIFFELNNIKEAALRFKQDVGQPPQFMAELLQSPDPTAADGMGGWWWRSDGNYPVTGADLPPMPASNLYSYDPAVGRGWNGPYLEREVISQTGKEIREIRINPVSAGNDQAMIDSSSELTPAKKIVSLKSDYGNYQQAVIADSQRMVSHYQFNFNDSLGDVVIAFLNDPTATTPTVVKKISLDFKP